MILLAGLIISGLFGVYCGINKKPLYITVMGGMVIGLITAIAQLSFQ